MTYPGFCDKLVYTWLAYIRKYRQKSEIKKCKISCIGQVPQLRDSYMHAIEAE